MKLITVVLCTCTVAFMFHEVQPAPVKKCNPNANVRCWLKGLPANPPKSARWKKEAFEHLVQYGYSHKRPNDMTFRDFEAAMKRYQKNVHISQTGKADKWTILTMQKPRCGRPDEDGYNDHGRVKRYSLWPIFWTDQHFTYKIQAYGSNPLTRKQARQSFVSAFKKWSDVTSLTFTPTTCSSIDFRIKFVAGCHGDGSQNCFDGPSGVLAHAYYPTFTNPIGGDIHMDDDEAWSTTTQNINTLSVAMHEIGHSLGLKHSSASGALMRPIYSGQQSLGQDDINGIQARYGGVTPDYNPNDSPIHENCVDRSRGYPQLDGTTTTTKSTTTTKKSTTTTTTTTTTRRPRRCCYYLWGSCWYYC